MTSSLDVAKYLIDVQLELGGLGITHLKLQKLVYYSQAIHLAMKDKPLFDEEIFAWKRGPVEAKVYEKYKPCGHYPIDPEEETDSIETGIDAYSISAISAILDAYGKMSAVALMEKTHREKPWQDAFARGSGTVIPKEVMQRYYKDFLTANDKQKTTA